MNRYSFTRCLPFIVLAVFFANPSAARQKYLTISGMVTDSKTGKPVPFASIGIEDKNEGTSSNAEGRFVFKVPESYQNERLKISSMGYQSVILNMPGSKDGVLKIVLTPASIALEEVLVQSKQRNAEEILKAAIAAIPRNYDTSAVQLTTFYREDTRLGDLGIAFSEAVMSVYKPPYADLEAEDQMKILKGRKKQFDHSKDPRFYVWLNLGGGAKYALVTGNLIKQHQKPHKDSFLTEKNFKHYAIKLDKVLTDGDRSVYVINMGPGKKSRKAYGRIKLYIDVQTLAFTKWEFELTQAGIDRENNSKFLLKKLSQAIMKANWNYLILKKLQTLMYMMANGT